MKKVIGFVLIALMLTSCATFADEEIVEVDKTSSDYLGTIEVSTLESNFLFHRDYDKNRDAMEHISEKLYEEAIEKYGENIELVNIETSTSWSAFSLFYYFSMLGFVEETTATADVIASDTPLQPLDPSRFATMKEREEKAVLERALRNEAQIRLQYDEIYGQAKIDILTRNFQNFVASNPIGRPAADLDEFEVFLVDARASQNKYGVDVWYKYRVDGVSYTISIHNNYIDYVSVG